MSVSASLMRLSVRPHVACALLGRFLNRRPCCCSLAGLPQMSASHWTATGPSYSVRVVAQSFLSAPVHAGAAPPISLNPVMYSTFHLLAAADAQVLHAPSDGYLAAFLAAFRRVKPMPEPQFPSSGFTGNRWFLSAGTFVSHVQLCKPNCGPLPLGNRQFLCLCMHPHVRHTHCSGDAGSGLHPASHPYKFVRFQLVPTACLLPPQII